MGRQLDKGRKKSVEETKETFLEEKAKPVPGVDNKDVKQGSIFSCANCSMMVFTVIVAMIVTSVIFKTVELQQLNTEQHQNIVQMQIETENLEGKLKKTISVSQAKDESNEMLIQSLNAEKEAFNGKINELDVQLSKQKIMLSEFQEKKANLEEVNAKMKDGIASLNQVIISNKDSFERKNKVISEKYEKAEQEISSLQQMHEIALSNNQAEKEAEANEFIIALSKNEDQLLIKSNSIKSLEDEIQIQTGKNIQLAKEAKYLVSKNAQLSEDLVGKSNSIESLQEQNQKLSNEVVELTEKTRQRIEILEEEKKTCINESETNTSTYLTTIHTKDDMVKKLEEEKLIIEKISEKRISDLENEHTTKLDILEASRGQMMEMIKSEKKEKNVLSDEKTTLERSLEDIQLEMDQVVHNLKMSQTNLEKCRTEKEMENKKKHAFEDDIKVLIQEKIEMETECKSRTEQLARIESEKEELKKQFENEIEVVSQENIKMATEYKSNAEKLASIQSEKEELMKQVENQKAVIE